jgi:hypothetical protein
MPFPLVFLAGALLGNTTKKGAEKKDFVAVKPKKGTNGKAHIRRKAKSR